ncbi:MAG: Cof-type HAD-IIB family hydrolase [Lachnospiraceae bacterium]|nr:Cof-type HAD-IIB family hydrolase [Lachnospiraceae bacterium]
MKLLFTDLDGTLLNNASQVSPATRAFLDDFLVAGNKLILSSGRPTDSVLEVKNNAGLNQPGILLCCYNGAQVYDCDSCSTIMAKRMPLPYVSYLQKQAAKHHLHIQTYQENAVVSPADDEEIRFYRTKIHVPLVVSPVLADALTDGPYKMLAADLYDHDKLEAFRLEIFDWTKGKIQTIYSNDKYLELFRQDAGKGNALHFVCEHFGVSLSDAYAAGDAENDISMLQAAGTGIAMRNASDQVKQAADIVTRYDNDHDGLAETMRRLL